MLDHLRATAWRMLTQPDERVYWGYLASGLCLAVVWQWRRGQAGANWRTMLRRAGGALRHPSVRIDVALVVVKSLVRAAWLVPAGFTALVVARQILRAGDVYLGRPPAWLVALGAHGLAHAIYSICLFVAWDYSQFALHRWMHRSPWLWPFHRVHHEAEVLTPLTVYRTHPVESALFELRGILVTGVVAGVALYVWRGQLREWQVLGVSLLGYGFNAVGGVLRHSHVPLSFGWLERWFISPVQHQLHHSATHRDVNYGAWLAVWDRRAHTLMSGTRTSVERFGVGAPQTLWHALGQPVWEVGRRLGVRPRVAVGLLVMVTLLSTRLALAQPTPAVAPDMTEAEAAALLEAAALDQGEEIIEIVDEHAPGSAHAVGAAELARLPRVDVHKTLATVPGVYVRQEDGFGLRPNIGMRGAAAERSAKVTLMEDDVLIAPAPYAAPAAYYFPTMARVIGLEATKGPGAIIYGPSTVGGALNLRTRAPSEGPTLRLDAAGGSFGLAKAHAVAGQSWGGLRLLLEGAYQRSSGFKQLDGGDDTGFRKLDGVAKLHYGWRGWGGSHAVELRGGYGREVSNETYTGLSLEDFAPRPYRRYAATALDQMAWQHRLVQLRYRLTRGAWEVQAAAYRHGLDRTWRKLDAMGRGHDLSSILAAPTEGNNGLYYAVLTGVADSTGPDDELLLGTNTRGFVAQGVQVHATWGQRAQGRHFLTMGARLHQDQVWRAHDDEPHAMRSGALLASDAPRRTLDVYTDANALAGYAAYELRGATWQANAGLRSEFIQNGWQERLRAGQPLVRQRYWALMPSLAGVWRPAPSLALLAGVHRGFSPETPAATALLGPEQSINYEGGVRYEAKLARLEVLGFYSDYQHLKGSCTFSTGCEASQVDTQYDAGAVAIRGVEVTAGALPGWRALRFPLQLAYTLTATSFRSAFVSENPQWGSVERGAELPYVPLHQLTLQAGVRHRRAELVASGRYVSPMRDVAGRGPGAMTDAQVVLDVAANVQVRRAWTAYATVDNVLDTAQVASLRPYGARPGVPRMVLVGLRYER